MSQYSHVCLPRCRWYICVCVNLCENYVYVQVKWNLCIRISMCTWDIFTTDWTKCPSVGYIVSRLPPRKTHTCVCAWKHSYMRMQMHRKFMQYNILQHILQHILQSALQHALQHMCMYMNRNTCTETRCNMLQHAATLSKLHTHMRTHTRTHTHAHTHARCRCSSLFSIYLFAYMYIYVHSYIYTYTYMYRQIHIYIYIYIYIYAHRKPGNEC